MKYIYSAIIYCEVSMVSEDPKKIYDYFQKIEEEKNENYGENYVANNDDYWISMIEADTPRAKEIYFDSSKSFFEFMDNFSLTSKNIEEKFFSEIKTVKIKGLDY